MGDVLGVGAEVDEVVMVGSGCLDIMGTEVDTLASAVVTLDMKDGKRKTVQLPSGTRRQALVNQQQLKRQSQL